MFPHAPLPHAVDLQSCRINDDMPWATPRKRRHLNLQRPLATTHRTVVGNGQGELHKFHHRREEPLSRAQAEVIDGFEDESALDRQIRIRPGRAWSCSWCGVAPRRDYLVVDPYGEATAIDKRAIILLPIANLRPEDRGQFGH